MKTNKFLNWMLMAAMTLGLGLGLTACSDDDDDKTDEQKAQEARAQQELDNTAFAVLGQLADVSDATVEDFADKTFEPTIGYDAGSNTHVENTNTMEAAALRFAYLTGADVDENTTSYTWTNSTLGSLTYTKVNDGTAWATVDVRIKQLPHLSKLIYRSPEQGGDNAAFTGRAYYRFGDVVKRVEGDETEYWVCVRPAFGLEKKEDSHWLCLNSLPEKNLFTYEKGALYWWVVPKNIGENKEHMQNLAEMLYAMLYPEQWRKNISDNATLKVFHDFNRDSIIYNNEFFFQAVAKAWDRDALWRKVFNTDKETLKRQLTNGGLNLLYKGHSWWTWTTSMNCSLWQACYTNGSGAKANMHTATYTTPKHNMQNIDFDCREMGDERDNYKDFFEDDNLRWCVRYKTGKQLAKNGVYDKRAAINGTVDEYRYYEHVLKTNDLTARPEVTEASVLDNFDSPSIGSIVGADGKFYRTVQLAQDKGGGAVAIVCTLNGKKRVEKGADWNGLAIALKKSYSIMTEWASTRELPQTCGLDTVTALKDAAAQLNGIANTAYLAGGCDGRGHDHPAAKRAREYTETSLGAAAKATGNFSEWFLPSIGQWILALKGFGYTWIDESGWVYDIDEFRDPEGKEKRDEQLAKYEKYFTDAGADMLSGHYWTSTPCTSKKAAYGRYRFSNNNWYETFLSSNYALPFLAFKYDGGAKQD